jgi:hypothetical protein
VAERPIDRGRLMICTYAIRDHLGTHPVASIMMRDLIARTARTGAPDDRVKLVSQPPVTLP